MENQSELQFIKVDNPAPRVNRITLNRPEKRNAQSNALRCELFAELQRADEDPDISVTILRGEGKAFSAGYDLNQNFVEGQAFYTAKGLSNWPRHVVEGSFRIWDLAKPIIAQVHGYCLAGGTELAHSCDLIYVADDALIGYPAVRSISPPDNQFFPWIMGMRQAMYMQLTGDSITGKEAARYNFANESYPAEDLEQKVLEIAIRVSKMPVELLQLNKRSVHLQMELMGMRAAIKSGAELQGLAGFSRTATAFFADIQGEKGLSQALTERDGVFEDGRTASKND
jgi:enoyl-CoA hydratase/carnithine racemase